ncbi:hypothetical protein BZA70DRAFT_281996 [Myxozyma melibiosi]|uniref:Nucleoporin Nup82 n=1 Tax=Myxozyma melibiosi TaxID=54550 RepID=A0ABR1F1N5_9ASCO
MGFIKDSRLQSVISGHPIFSGIAASSSLPSLALTFPTPSSTSTTSSLFPATNSTPTLSGSGTDDLVQNIIAIRGSELFVVVEGQIRCVDCVTMRDAKSLRFYKVLNIPRIEFVVRRLQINETGTLMAIIGDQNILTCVLPLPGFSKLIETRLHSRHRAVGEAVFSADLKIKMALWHPLSKEDNCLIVLCSDNVLRMFDLSYSYDEPEQVFEFGAPQQDRRASTFGLLDDDCMEMVSMCFGVPEQGLGTMSLYVLSSEGDICVLAPFIPRYCAIERESINLMLQWAIAEDRDTDIDITTTLFSSPSSSSREETARIERFRRRQQVTWVAEVTRQCNTASLSTKIAPRINKYGDPADLCVFERPDTSRHVVKLQGPLRPMLFPASLYGSTSCDITTLEVDEDLTVLLTVDQRGKVNIFLQDAPNEALWESSILSALYSDEEERLGAIEQPVIQTLESLQLKVGSSAKFGSKPAAEESTYWFVDSKAGNDTVLLMSAHRAVELDISKWKRKLSEALASAHSEPELQQLFLQKGGKPKSEVKTLLNSSSNGRDRSLGAIFLPDAFFGDVLITLCSTGSVEVFVDSDGSETQPNVPGSPLRKAIPPSKSSAEPIYQPLMNPVPIETSALASSSTLEAALARNRRSVNFSMTERPVEVSEEALRFLGSAAVVVGSEMRNAQSVGLRLQRRLMEQRGELDRQLGKLREILEKSGNSSSHTAVNAQVNEILARQQALNERADKIYKRLIETQPLPLSDVEVKWIQELHRVKGKVEEQKAGLKARSGSATLQAKKIVAMTSSMDGKAQDITSKRNSQLMISGLRTAKIENLKEMIENEYVCFFNNLTENMGVS